MPGHRGGMSGRDSVQIPDDRDFGAFRAQCESESGWSLVYSKGGVAVWVQLLEPERALHKIKVRPPARHSPVRAGTSPPPRAPPRHGETPPRPSPGIPPGLVYLAAKGRRGDPQGDVGTGRTLGRCYTLGLGGESGDPTVNWGPHSEWAVGG